MGVILTIMILNIYYKTCTNMGACMTRRRRGRSRRSSRRDAAMFATSASGVGSLSFVISSARAAFRGSSSD